ncbi:uncharacterized protein F4812DRAFT_150151 [Daldinia caldariorum]|uniref:uncharacterized protein n=1 Tax=Daldinia caldariorum TaxID=326644 RepID=UPI0020085859|nr:uncharacterized protein F4812DRAFT_150151 [Daldinia caldariorum]KAI1464674.1 hypothetical protein F4812DRAFT_150151 [Daldinia caldariorum]
MTSSVASILLGPLTTTWTPPPACNIAVAACKTCSLAWQAQTCRNGDQVQDALSCWPPRTLGATTPAQPLFAWGLYSPGLVCPQGYTTACSYNGAKKTGDFNFYFSPEESETVVGCCPPGYACSRHDSGQTCITTLTSTTVPTVTCESGTSAHFEYVTIPYAAVDASFVHVISTFTVYAPLFQLNHQATDLPSITEEAIGTSTSSSSTTSTTSTMSIQMFPPPTSPTESSNRPGLSAGVQAAIGCGVAFGIIISLTIAFFVFRSRRRKADSQPIELQSDERKLNELQGNELQGDEIWNNGIQSYEHEPKFRMRPQARVPGLPMGTDPLREAVEFEDYHGTNHGPYQPSTRPFI